MRQPWGQGPLWLDSFALLLDGLLYSGETSSVFQVVSAQPGRHSLQSSMEREGVPLEPEGIWLIWTEVPARVLDWCLHANEDSTSLQFDWSEHSHFG